MKIKGAAANDIVSILKEAYNVNDEIVISDIAKVADWAFREGWRERSRMVGVSKKYLDKQFYDRIRIMLENKHYEKAFENKHLGKIHLGKFYEVPKL